MLIFTIKEAEKILSSKNGKARISCDFGLSYVDAVIKDDLVRIDTESIPLLEFRRVKEKKCYVFEDNILKEIAFFSPESSFYYKLLPTDDWPTVCLSSTPMHRFAKVSPKKHAELFIKEISPVKGFVLDTCCGLGYTAILESKHAKKVYAFENDENVLRIASYNPHSQDLFTNKNITLAKKSVSEGIKEFPDNYFDRIIHDPPTFTISPELYFEGFHKQLFRVLKKQGILFHYCPLPHKTKGHFFPRKIIASLKKCGFLKVEYKEDVSGIRAIKA